MGRLSRDKGAALEREVVAILKTRGFPLAARALDAAHGGGGCDITGVPGLCIQVKGGARPDPWRAWAEAAEETAEQRNYVDYPIAFVRRNRGQWMAMLTMDDFLAIFTPAKNPKHYMTPAELDALCEEAPP